MTRVVSMEGVKTLVVVPTYNERESLPHTIAAIRQYNSVDILVVDDGSPDGTGEWVRNAPGFGDWLFILPRTEKSGLGPAYIAGFQWALERDYDVICEMDADGSHRGRDLPELLAAVERGADLAIGSRWIFGGATVNWPWQRNMLSRSANVYTNMAIGLGVHDATAGFRAFKRRVLETLELSGVESAGYCFQIDMTLRTKQAGFRIVEVPVTFVEREYGESKMSGGIIKEAFTRVAQWGLARRQAQVKALVKGMTGYRS